MAIGASVLVCTEWCARTLQWNLRIRCATGFGNILKEMLDTLMLTQSTDKLEQLLIFKILYIVCM